MRIFHGWAKNWQLIGLGSLVAILSACEKKPTVGEVEKSLREGVREGHIKVEPPLPPSEEDIRLMNERIGRALNHQ